MSDPLEHIRLGRIDESFHQVAAAVVEEVLVRLGHAVEMSEDSHMYPMLRDGKMAPFADAPRPRGLTEQVPWISIWPLTAATRWREAAEVMDEHAVCPGLASDAGASP